MKNKSQQILRDYAVYIALLLLTFFLSIATGTDFLSPRNLSNLMRQTSINGILALGMTLVILTGGIDLSIGSVVALAGVVVGYLQVHAGWADLGVTGAFLSVAVGVGVGLLIGALNGTLTTVLGVAPFVITLGLMVIARGLALIFSGGAAISPMGDELTALATKYLSPSITIALLILLIAPLLWQARREVKHWVAPLLLAALGAYIFLGYRGFPVIVLFLAVLALVIATLANRTTFGRSVYAIGSNERAAFWAGVQVKPTLILVYTIMGALAGLVGVLLSARLNSADPNAGQLFELDAIAAVVIGGTSLRGGQGRLSGSLAGALTIASLNNGMDLLGVTSFYQMVLKGTIIIAAVSLDRRK
jgi:D-xylose transport system permease protein